MARRARMAAAVTVMAILAGCGGGGGGVGSGSLSEIRAAYDNLTLSEQMCALFDLGQLQMDLTQAQVADPSPETFRKAMDAITACKRGGGDGDLSTYAEYKKVRAAYYNLSTATEQYCAADVMLDLQWVEAAGEGAHPPAESLRKATDVIAACKAAGEDAPSQTHAP